ncbi:hypothetical protein FB45DRAFT_1033110 [Roridomyces roridus]|uniref:MYND-type domain-containing protein n=1 Tax=Roridomyces roridus TaxID=1738132 RepID=A0AAD7BGL5_9AGAR|nr:hypothetical protein FB45DRAFT_1033110 [Roridomyces roridus]
MSNHPEILHRVRATPNRYIRTARVQNIEGLTALSELGRVWTEIPGIVGLGAIDVFLSHLRSELAPSSPREWDLDAEFAHFALLALSQMQGVDDPKCVAQSRAILAGLPGILKWSQYIFDTKLTGASSSQEQCMYSHALLTMLSAFVLDSHQSAVATARTSGFLELATRLWVWDDDFASLYASQAVGMLLKYSPKPAHDRMIGATAGDAEFVIKLVLRRTKIAIKKLDSDGGNRLGCCILLINDLCEPQTHALRRAFHDADGFRTVTRSFLAFVRTISKSPDPTPAQIAPLSWYIEFFSSHLERDDYLAVVNAVKAGFLRAFIDCSPAFLRLAHSKLSLAAGIVHTLMPYLVYHSFIDEVAPLLEDLDRQRLSTQSPLKSEFERFWSVLSEHINVLGHIKEEVVTRKCENIKCQSPDTEQSFKTCKACQATYYCSQECQRADWEAQHREFCASMKGESRCGRRSRRDITGLQTLGQRIVDLVSTTFHSIAERDFPNTPRGELVPCLDLSCFPPRYSIQTLRFAIGDRDEYELLAEKCRAQKATVVLCFRKNGASVGEAMWLTTGEGNFWDVQST